MKKQAFNLIEVMVTMVIIGIFGAALLASLKNDTLSIETYKKSGSSFYMHLEFASKTILAKNTINYSFSTLRGLDGTKIAITVQILFYQTYIRNI